MFDLGANVYVLMLCDPPPHRERVTPSENGSASPFLKNSNGPSSQFKHWQRPQFVLRCIPSRLGAFWRAQESQSVLVESVHKAAHGHLDL